MKPKHLLLASLVALSVYACKKSSDPLVFFPGEIGKVTTSLTKSFDSLNRDMAASAVTISQNAGDTAAIRSKMLGLFSSSSFILEFAFITPQGIMQIIEPALYHYLQGSDISGQNHVIKAFQTKQPVLSESFLAVEGYYAAVDIHPVLNNAQVAGGITALFFPQAILGRIITPLVKNQPFEMWVMEKGGKVLYDQDTLEIGRNVFTDSLYKAFPELITAAHLIDSQQSGETYYSFYQTGTTIKVIKKTYWSTYVLFGTEWKIIWVKPE
jgi:hypothetical protein